jgi:CheY-like chemotaxis protein
MVAFAAALPNSTSHFGTRSCSGARYSRSVKRLVEMHDGEVWARSEGLGRGASFEIRLPRIARPQASGAGPAALKAQPRRVLIVDDDVDAANSLSMLLSLQGHETQVAYGAREALACSGSFRPDIGLLDIGLPEMDGYELASDQAGRPGRARACADRDSRRPGTRANLTVRTILTGDRAERPFSKFARSPACHRAAGRACTGSRNDARRCG